MTELVTAWVMELVGAIRSAGNLEVEVDVTPISVPAEPSSGSDVGIRMVSRRLRNLGPGLDLGESELGLELELDEPSSAEETDTIDTADFSPVGTLTAVPSLTSPTGAEGSNGSPIVPPERPPIAISSVTLALAHCAHS